ncbi:MAG: nucleotidyltransferase [Bacilli bacterium]|nr:nucleotidyltransferase [Bacilli bacterium]
MNKDITLVILAAGMGSRFGGLKQVESMGPNGEFIIDYSIYDAIKAGFNKVVFLIKKENYKIFKETIGHRVENKIKVEYCFQKNDNVPEEYKIPITRIKPLGTAHAILCCKSKIKEPFMIINADDFYGRDAFMKAAEYLRNMDSISRPYHYGMVCYLAKNTITENGSVKRGVVKIENKKLKKITESSVKKVDNKLIANPLSDEEMFEISENESVSMNMLLFSPSIFKYIKEKFPAFLEKNKYNLDRAEYLIPDVLFDSIKDNYASVDIINTNATWYGVTYREDEDAVKIALRKMIKKGKYENHLWGGEE